MKREDLFLAIGQVEEERLARCENAACPSGADHWEDNHMDTYAKYKRKRRVVRNLLIAAIVVTMLATTALAAGYLLYDNPADMLGNIFGDQTGYDHSDGSIRPDPWGSDQAIVVEPTYDRVPVDETVAEKDIIPFVSPVGQSVSWRGHTITVDAFLYDPATRCGFFTYLLENPQGVSGYKLQTNGEIWYEQGERLLEVNQSGESYIIQEKTTDTCLAATYYFRFDPDWGENLKIGFCDLYGYTAQSLVKTQEELTQKFREEMTEEEAVAAWRQDLGDELYKEVLEALKPEEIPEAAYTHLAVMEMERRIAEEACQDWITINCDAAEPLRNLLLAEGGITLSPISIRFDTTGLGLTHVDRAGTTHTDSNKVDSLVIRFHDGEEYVVSRDYILNYVFAINELPEDNVAERVYVSPEEDPNGEGYFYTVNSRGYCLYTFMFNRIIDLDQVSAIIINGTEFPVE